MRHAPPIALTVCGGGAWRAAQAGLPALAAAAVVAWVAAWASFPTFIPAVLAGAVLGAFAWRAAAPRPVHLQWNGEHWAADGAAGEMDLMLDLGAWMLLRFRPAAGRPLWLPVPRREAGASEQGLRAALYARGTPAAPGQA